MSANLITVETHATLFEVQRLLVVAHVSGVPVVDTPDVVWISPDATVTDAARLMRDEGIHRVLVGTRERLVGILTAFDLLRAI